MIYIKEGLTREQLRTIPVPARDNVSTHWKGVPHGELADALVGRVTAAQLMITREYWTVNPKQDTLWGAVDISMDSPSILSRDLSLDIEHPAQFSLGVRHSNGGRYAISLVVGARIAVCSNGMFSGEIDIRKKHTDSLELDTLLDQGIQEYLDQCDRLEGLIHSLQHTPVSNQEAAYTMFEAHRRGLVNFRYLEDVARLWREPGHDEFKDRTAWSLYNAFTEMAKDLSAARQTTLLQGLTAVVVDCTGVRLRNRK